MGILGAAVGAAGSIFGGIAASKAVKNVKNNIKKQMGENQDWYDRRFNEDATQRADAQRILTMAEESIRNRNKEAAGTQAVMGGTDESVAAAKAANNQALADATSAIAANADRRKDAIEEQYMSTKAGLNNQLNNMEMQKAKAISSAVGGLNDAMGGLDLGTFKAGKKEFDL